MTKEQIIDSIIVSMAVHITKEQLSILNTVLVNEFHKFDIAELQVPATQEQSNEQFINMFMVLKGNKLSQKTMKVYLATLKDFMLVINKPLNKVTSLDVEYYLNVKQKTCNEKSLNNYKRNLSAFYTFLRKKKIVTYNPCDEVESYKEIQKPIDHLEVVEKETLKNGCKDKRDRALIEFLRCTGLRVGELTNVKVRDLDMNTGKIVIFGEKTKTYRFVKVDVLAMSFIKEYLAERNLNENSYMFSHLREEKQLDISSITKIVKNIGKRSGLERRVYVHLFRHTLATDIVRKGGSMSEAGEYLGHKEQSVTGRHYTFIDDSHTEKIFEKYVKAV